MLGMSRLKMKMNLMFDMGNRKDINLYIMASYGWCSSVSIVVTNIIMYEPGSQ